MNQNALAVALSQRLAKLRNADPVALNTFLTHTVPFSPSAQAQGYPDTMSGLELMNVMLSEIGMVAQTTESGETTVSVNRPI